jgi:hypothetical protein
MQASWTGLFGRRREGLAITTGSEAPAQAIGVSGERPGPIGLVGAMRSRALPASLHGPPQDPRGLCDSWLLWPTGSDGSPLPRGLRGLWPGVSKPAWDGRSRPAVEAGVEPGHYSSSPGSSVRPSIENGFPPSSPR